MTIADMAKQIASRAHSGQFRRDRITPYLIHPERVAGRVSGDCEAEAVAWLHDVLEDSDETDQTLAEAGMPDVVIDAVHVLTKRPGIRYEDYLAEINRNDLARKVKIQDMIDNLSDSPSERQIVKYAKGLLVLHGEGKGG